MTAYLISMATYVGFFMILALALNLQWGMTGMVNFGIAGFYALGAYTSGLLTTKAGWPVGLAMPMAAVTGMVAGALVALLSIRLREDFLAVVTLGFGEIVRLIALNEDQITEGPRGLKIDARPFAGMFDRETYPLVYLALVAAVVALTFFVAERIRRSPLVMRVIARALVGSRFFRAWASIFCTARELRNLRNLRLYRARLAQSW